MIGSKYVFINIKSPPYFILLFVEKTIRIRGKKLNALDFTSCAKGNVLIKNLRVTERFVVVTIHSVKIKENYIPLNLVNSLLQILNSISVS